MARKFLLLRLGIIRLRQAAVGGGSSQGCECDSLKDEGIRRSLSRASHLTDKTARKATLMSLPDLIGQYRSPCTDWIPAFAGMTTGEVLRMASLVRLDIHGQKKRAYPTRGVRLCLIVFHIFT